ncbi:MAG: hypothetical protein ACTSRL_21875, partial [Candidatus Helarchaeota archaeon]
MPKIRFAPISKETPIPGTNFSIQIGVIQNQERSWGVKLSQAGKVIAAKKIKKLIDVEIVGIIRDTIGKKVALDTFELGATMSNLLRETYERIRSKQKQTAAQKSTPQPAPQPAPAPTIQPPPAPRQTQAPPTPTPQTTPPPTPQAAPQPAQKSQSEIEATLANMKIPTHSTAGAEGDSFWSAYSSISMEEYSYDTEPTYEPATPQQPTTQAPAI